MIKVTSPFFQPKYIEHSHSKDAILNKTDTTPGFMELTAELGFGQHKLLSTCVPGTDRGAWERAVNNASEFLCPKSRHGK